MKTTSNIKITSKMKTTSNLKMTPNMKMISDMMTTFKNPKPSQIYQFKPINSN